MAETLAPKIKAAAINCAVFIVDSLSFEQFEVNGQVKVDSDCAVPLPSRRGTGMLARSSWESL